MKLEQNMEFIYYYRTDRAEYPDKWESLDDLGYHFYKKVSEQMSHIITLKNMHKSVHFIITDVFISPKTFNVLVKVEVEQFNK